MDRFKCVFCGRHGSPVDGFWCEDRSCEGLEELMDHDFYMVHQINKGNSRAVGFSHNSIPSLVLDLPVSLGEILEKILGLGDTYSIPEYVQDMGLLFEIMIPTEDEKEEYEGLIKELKAPAKTKKDIRKELNEMPF